MDCMDVKKRVSKCGGVTAVIKVEQIFPGLIVTQKHGLNKESNLLKYTLGTNVLWIASIYLNKGSTQQVRKVMSRVKSLVSETHLSKTLLIGDFNIDLAKKSDSMKLLEVCCKNLRLRIHSPENLQEVDPYYDFGLQYNS